MIDFDAIDKWAPELELTLREHVPKSAASELVAAKPEYVEDTCDLLFRLVDRDKVIRATIDWIQQETVLAYHGSRLTEDDIRSIRSVGLIPLEATSRRVRLVRALSRHPGWNEEHSVRLDRAIEDYGRRNGAGHREGQVHLTLSKAGLTQGFNHYLKYGSEFDQHAGHSVLGQEGKELLMQDGKATVITVALPGGDALQAAHPYFTLEDMLKRGEVPNIVHDFLQAWSFRLAHPQFQCATLEVDCGMIVQSAVPPQLIVAIQSR